jgi:RsiW-degrading membrane proteinase PrsW (M82 family)
MAEFIKNYPFLLAPILAMIPALVWLWFWLKEDRHPEPLKMIVLSFLGGMVTVFAVLPLQKLVYNYLPSPNTTSFVIWAAIEEVLKFLFIYVIALSRKVDDEPIDSIIYMIIGALGFVSMENTLFLITPIGAGDLSGAIITGSLRFIGASLLHTLSSATIGIFMAFSFYKSRFKKIYYTLSGIILAIVLHSAFNLSIIQEIDGSLFIIFGTVWIGIIIVLLLFEKIKTISA